MSAADPLAPPSSRAVTNDGSFVLFVKIAFHTVLLLVLPFIVGGFAGLFCDIKQVSDTLSGLVRFAATFLLPVLIAQGVGIAVKVNRERKAMELEGPLPPGALLLTVYRHVRVMTDKGLALLIAGLLALVMALGLHFADFGLIAILGLATLYTLTAVGILLSTFVVARFEERLATRGGVIGREFSPVVVEAGDSVEERFHLERVPVPPGFNVKIHQQLPARLETESRHVVSSAVSNQRITLARAVRRTPRGEYTIGPAAIAYSDLFGLTEVAVAQAAGARLKVLPRMHNVVLAESPRVISPEEGVLSILKRFPTDDHFRFRDYQPGDDGRRIHWKLSLKVGRLQVRLPETVPVVPRKIRLVLDTLLPMALATESEADVVLGDLLDRLVEAWISLARALTERGEDVTLVMPTGTAEKPIEELHCRAGTQPRWRELGSRAMWQRWGDIHHAGYGTQKGQILVVVTARLVPLPELPQGMGITWVLLPVAPEMPGPVPGTQGVTWRSAFLSAFAPGSMENGLFVSYKRSLARRRLENLRQYVVNNAVQGNQAAETAIRARNEALYIIRRSGASYVLMRA